MTENSGTPSAFTEFATTMASVRPVPPPPGEGGNALPAGYKIHEFEIVQVVGVGGFGIVYLAHDLQLQRTVALKEYMPSSLATRGADHGISLRSERHRETFELGLRSFVNEARLLASFDHPSLVKVYRFWEQNGTAFMVMPFYEGPTLKALFKQSPHPPDEAWLKNLLRPLLDALQIIHNDHCYHRDIAPDNILLLGSQLKPLLLDFGAARRVIGDATQALTVILKPGYAPVEQYAEVPSMKQGAWTDVYALCAVLYAGITGRAPTPSVGRLMKDEMVPVSESARGRYSAPFLAAIDRGLAVRPEHRPQDINSLRASLFATELPDAGDDVTQIRPTIAPAPVLLEPAGGPPSTGFGALAAPQSDFRPPSPAPAARKSRVPLIAGVAMLAVGAGVVWFLTRGSDTPGEAAAPSAATTPAVAAAASSSIAPPAVPEVAAPVRGAFSTVAALEDIVRHSDPLISVNTLADKQSLVIGRDRMKFRVKSSEAGYLYVFFSGTDNAGLTLLFPNANDAKNRIAADTELLLPRETWNIDAGGPPGVNHIVTMVSRSPRDFSGVGLKPANPLSEFDLATLQRLWSAAPNDSSVYAGTARCVVGAACPPEFGATLIRIAEEAPGK
ncbi:MAG: serine/threonine-protein kinase [Burkholderiales bacterium]|nr:serine/threonine-protein kinase [Burkholderiales bacterium]